MSELMERLDNLRALIQEPEFLEGKGLSNEVNIRIFCYDPKDEMAIRHFTEKLMTDQSLNCHLIEYNLYNQKSATLAGFGVIALIILGACFWLAKRTSVRKK